MIAVVLQGAEIVEVGERAQRLLLKYKCCSENKTMDPKRREEWGDRAIMHKGWVFRALGLAPGAGSRCRAGVVLWMGGSDRNQYFVEVKNGYSMSIKWKWAGYWSWSCREWVCGIVWQCSQQWVREKGRANRKQKPHEKEGASSYRKPGLARLLGLPGCGKS